MIGKALGIGGLGGSWREEEKLKALSEMGRLPSDSFLSVRSTSVGTSVGNRVDCEAERGLGGRVGLADWRKRAKTPGSFCLQITGVGGTENLCPSGSLLAVGTVSLLSTPTALSAVFSPPAAILSALE